MRDYKFRGKRIDNGEWVYGDLWQHQGNTWIVTVIEGEARRFTVDPETVGQYINKKDTSGKEVYEGDYDIEGGVYFIAQYQDGDLGMITQEPGFSPDFDTCVNWHNFTVCGSRWDNPDLLEGGYE